jgi:hypothetical protein
VSSFFPCSCCLPSGRSVALTGGSNTAHAAVGQHAAQRCHYTAWPPLSEAAPHPMGMQWAWLSSRAGSPANPMLCGPCGQAAASDCLTA